jgi:hypothetical protein
MLGEMKMAQQQQDKYSAHAILFIKFGKSNPFAEESIKKGIIKFSYKEISHTDCVTMANRNVAIIDSIRGQIQQFYNCNDEEVTSHLQQLRLFYDYYPNTMFVTVYEGKLWYCFGGANETLILNKDLTKERGTIDGWKNTDINGNPFILADFLENIQFDTYVREIDVLKENNKRFVLSKVNGDTYIPVHIDTSEAWSDEAKKQTRDSIDSGWLPIYKMKGIDSSGERRYGELSMVQRSNGGLYTVKLAESDKSEHFQTVDELLDAGWVVD